MRPERAPRASWLLASTSAAALTCWSGAAVAECTGTPGVSIQASLGETCTASGTFTSTDVIAGQATGGGSVLTNEGGEGFNSFSFSTSGPDTPAVQADTGGLVTLTVMPPSTVGTVTTTGVGGIGLFATGAGSSITAIGVAVATSGNFDPSTTSASNGLVAVDGATAAFSGGSINTAGNAAYAVVANSGGLVSLNGTTIGTTGNGSGGLGINGAGSEIDATGVTITTTGTEDPISGEHSYGVYNGPYGTFAAGGVAKLTDVSISTQGVQMYGVITNTGATTSILGGSIATAGTQANGVLAENGGTVTIGVSNSGATSVVTSGTSAPGVVAYVGGAVQITGATIATNGDGSSGLSLNGAGSSITATGISVTTRGGIDTATGNHADGAYNGPYPPGGVTSGGFLSLANSTVATSGAIADGVVTGTGGTTTISGGSVTTSGPSSYAIAVNGGGAVTLNGTTISTTANGSGGFSVEGAGSTLTASGVSVTTQGAMDPTTGDHSYGLFNGPSGAITSGGVAKLTDTSISTQGVEMFGVLTETGGATTILGGSIATSGAGAHAILAQNGGAVTVGVSASGPTTISTTGTSAPDGTSGAAVVAYNGGAVQLTGATVTTSGAGSTGLVVHGATSSLSASGVTVITTGGIDPATGDHAVGADNAPYLPGGVSSGGFMSLTNSAIATNGAGATGVVTEAGGSTTLIGTNVSTAGPGAPGVFTDAGGVTNVNGGSVNTAGQDAHALFVTGLGSQANLSGAGAFATTGAGAIGLYAALGGVISSAGSMTIITTAGGVSPATGLGAYGVNADGAGSQIKLGSATIITSGAGATGLFASDRASSGAAGAITATGTLNVQTKSASASAVALQGNGAAITATGGGTITAAATAIAFLSGTGQSATFDNFDIGNLSGDLVFADPSTATLNFNKTTANAGTNNLLNATAGSAITLNASASTLTGAIRTDAASTSNVNLMNGTTWNLTAPSTVTNLNDTHSIIAFAPPGSGGGFKTLTVNNYVGNGANIIMNAALGGSSSASDQIIINGGKATGSTLLTINNVGGAGALTTGNGIPLVVATNGGSVAPDAFTLANTPIVGGYRYTLDESGNDWYLVSSPTATVGGVTTSINNVAKAQQSQMITNRVLGSILLGATQQISCSSCGGGFASVGSFALGGDGRWSLSDALTFIGGVSYNQWSASGITVYNAPTAAGALVYDFVNWGSSRPFLEVGAGLTPYEQVNTTRTYPNGLTTGYGYSTATDRDLSLFGRAGWVDRLTPIDEAAAYADLGRSWMATGGSSEATTAINPFPATVPPGLATLNVARLGAQYTHLFGGNIETNVSVAVAYGFGASSGAPFSVSDFGTIAPGAIGNSAWFEYGARVGYRFNDRLVVDAFLLGTAGGEAGNFVHGGVGVRYSFSFRSSATFVIAGRFTCSDR